MADLCDLANERNTGSFVCDNTIKTLDYVSTSAEGEITYDLELQDGTTCTFIIKDGDIVNVTLLNVPNDATPINAILANIVQLLNEQATLEFITELAQQASDSANTAAAKLDLVIEKEASISEHYDAIDTANSNIDKIKTVNDLKDAITYIVANSEMLNNLDGNATLESLYEDIDKLNILYNDKNVFDSAFQNKENLNLIAGDLSNSYSHIEDSGFITDEVESSEGESTLANVSNNMANVNNVGSNINSVNSTSTNIADIIAVAAKIVEIINVSGSIDNVNNVGSSIAKIGNVSDNISSIIENANNIDVIRDASDNAKAASDKATEALNSADRAKDSETNSQKDSWIANAHELTAYSYARQPEDEYVKVYTSNQDGTFSYTETEDYSAYHWRQKAKAAVTSDDLLLKSDNLADISDIAIARENIGLGNVDNTSDADKPISTDTQEALDLKAKATDLTDHTDNTANPHSVTKSDVGLGNVDNTSDTDKPISTSTQIVLDSLSDFISNLATAQASIAGDASIDIDTTQQLIGINTSTPSTNTEVLSLDDDADTMTFHINASINFFSNMVFTSSTPNERNISIKVIDDSDDSVLESFDMALTIPNGSTETISHTFLLTVGKNGTPDAPLTVRFEIVADDTGYSLDSFNSVVATSSSYDLLQGAVGIKYDNSVSGSTATNVQDALDEALDLDFGGIV